jgi:poly(3-hydroxybutyrate) depolymerase
MLIITYGARAQETKERVTVNDVDRTCLVRLPREVRCEAEISGGDPAAWHESGYDMKRLTRFNDLADKDGIIAVYPVRWTDAGIWDCVSRSSSP